MVEQPGIDAPHLTPQRLWVGRHARKPRGEQAADETATRHAQGRGAVDAQRLHGGAAQELAGDVEGKLAWKILGVLNDLRRTLKAVAPHLLLIVCSHHVHNSTKCTLHASHTAAECPVGLS